MPRVRHHTSDEGLAGIKKDGGIRASRGWGRFEAGVHVEIEPFATALPFVPREKSSPLNDFGCYGEGAFVEFDQPADLLWYYCGPRAAGFIPVPMGKLLRLEALHPTYVIVRYHWWQWWRAKVE